MPRAGRRMPGPRFRVVRLGSLGDIMHAFPAVAALRKSFPAARIVWLTHPRWAFLVQSSRLASEVWAIETREMSSLGETVRRLRQNSWNAAIDYQGLWKSAMLPFFGGVARRIGFASATIREFGVPVLYTERVETSKEHIAEQTGDLSLRAGAQLGTCAVGVVGGDTGPVHLAAALHTRTVALFGPTDPARNGPYRGGDTQPSEHADIVLRASGVRTTHKRSSQPHPSMLAISVDQVFDAVSRCIGAPR